MTVTTTDAVAAEQASEHNAVPASASSLGLTRKDFQSDIDPRWCPGCGCYAVLKALTSVFPELDIPREKFAVISGIGCSSRLPYYVNTYGMHTLHGRAMTIATGLKISRPDLNVWVITGDGDALSIGGNHFMHMLRRNPDIKVILFNNQIYGLTKGQASPTTAYGTRTKSTPWGSIDQPVRPLALAIAAGATFVARTTDRDIKQMQDIFKEAAQHKGVAFIEVYLNCVIFNDGAYKHLTDKATRDETTIQLADGEPLLFGASRDKGVRLTNLRPEVVRLDAENVTPSDIITHDVSNPDPTLAYMLSLMQDPLEPVPFGVFRKISRPTYEELCVAQEQKAKAQKGEGVMRSLLCSGDTWQVKADDPEQP